MFKYSTSTSTSKLYSSTSTSTKYASEAITISTTNCRQLKFLQSIRFPPKLTMAQLRHLEIGIDATVYSDLETRGEVTQGHRNRHDRSTVYDFLLTFHSNHGPISYRYRDKRQFPSKIANFSHPRVFCVPAEGVPLGIGYRRWESKTRMMGQLG